MANIGASKGTNKAYSDYANALDGMMVTKKYNYEGNPVSFSSNGTIMVNATEMAKPFGKEAKHWLVNQTTKEYIEELANVRNLTFADLVQVKQGSPDNGGGTWMHEDVAMEFARWLSPKFAIWCNDRIKELLTMGKTEIKPLTPAQQLLANAQMLVEMERRQMEQERQQKVLESRQATTEHRVNEIEERIKDNTYMTVMGFANIHRLKIGTKALQRLGRQCSTWCRRMGMIPEQTKHEKWGHVNTYPMQALKAIFKANYPDKSAMFDIHTYWG